MLIMIATILLVFNMATATEYSLNPMNFQPGQSRNLSVSVVSPGDIINVSYPSEFTLISGSEDGNSSITFVIESPDNASDGQIFYLNITINNVFLDSLLAISVPDNEIVDTKWELGHGNFNYPECQYIPNESVLIFPIIRVWGVGTDLLDEAATNITFTCNYPKLMPRTVDSKFTTDYSDPSYLTATGNLDTWEGASLFRVFVLSQEIEYNVGQNYQVTCSDLSYEFNHHTISAEISSINITVTDPTPFTVATATTSNYVQYTITNAGAYEVRDIEFLWQQDNNQIYRTEKDSMQPGDAVVYRVWANGNPTITFDIRQKPCWMFNSRDPTSYEQQHSGSFSINSNSTVYFSVEEAIFYNAAESSMIDISEQIDQLLFLFKINTEQYHMDVSVLPDSQQNEANFTCYRLGIQSNGFSQNPIVKVETNASDASQVIIKDDNFLTKEFDFTIDQDGIGVVSWEVSNLGVCSEEEIDSNFVCPTTYNYMCLQHGLQFKAEQQEPPADCVLCKEKVLEIGALVSPSYPSLGIFIIIAIIVGLIYLYYYYQDDISLKGWIQESKQKKERESYVKWREEQRRQ